MELKTIIFMELVILSFLLNYKDEKNTCKNMDTGIAHYLFFHHLIAIYIICGWFLLSPRFAYFYVYFTLLLIIHWIYNNNRCILTDIYYHICGNIDYHNKKSQIYLKY